MASNAWIVTRDGTLVTRPLQTGILPGITRSVVVDLIAREGLGFLIMNGKEFFQTEVVVLGMVLISTTVLITDFVFRQIENWVLRWKQ